MREGLRLNGHVPILALESLRRSARRSFTFATDFEIVRDEEGANPPELDFAVVQDGTLILGEAKKRDRLSDGRPEERRKAARIVSVASHLSADNICLATTQPSWNEGTISVVNEALSGSNLTAIYLTNLGRVSTDRRA